VDSLLRREPSTSAATPAAPGGTDASATRDEVGRLMAPVLRKGGDLSPADRTYLAKVVAARTGLSEAEAQKRVSDTVTQAKQAADAARKAAAKMMLWTAAAMLAGAVAAMLGATEGGVLRDSKWYEPGWRAVTVRNH
jgi:hypothetical protein